MDTWNLIKTERLATADAFGELSDEEWDAPSLCDGWRNRDTLAHVVATAELTTGGFLGGLVKNGFSFNKMVTNDIKRVGADEPAQLIDRLRTAAGGTNHPPGPVPAMLMEIVVHGEDVAYPLGRKIDHDDAAMRDAADFAKNAQPLVGVRKRIAGLEMSATDADWSTGSGSKVSGPMVPLLLAMSGRSSAAHALSGDGVTTLRQRA